MNLVEIQNEAEKLYKKKEKLNQAFRDYCEEKRFRIVKDIYYSGYQDNLIGRECILHPSIQRGKLMASCTVYNKRTKKIDINHYYLHDMSFYEELK